MSEYEKNEEKVETDVVEEKDCVEETVNCVEENLELNNNQETVDDSAEELNNVEEPVKKENLEEEEVAAIESINNRQDYLEQSSESFWEKKEKEMKIKSILSIIDHTVLKQGLLEKDIDKLCDEALKYGFKTVCVYPKFVKQCAKKLSETNVGVCTVIGFPFGENTTEVKAYEAKCAMIDGATEIDLVLSNSAIKRNDYNSVKKEILKVKKAAKRCTLKVIIETCLLTSQELHKVCNIILKTNAQFVKTSTGFAKEGAVPAIVNEIKQIVGDNCGIKASGGIKNEEDLISMVKAGATRIGTSHAVEIAEEVLAKYSDAE